MAIKSLPTFFERQIYQRINSFRNFVKIHFHSAMKKQLFLFLPLLVLTACTSEYDKALNDASRAKRSASDDIVFYATIEGSDDADLKTKVYADEQLRVLWNKNDLITIFNQNTFNQPCRFTGDDGANAGGFRIEQTDDDFPMSSPMDYIYAIYPYDKTTAISYDGVITFNLPAEQHYLQNSFGYGANTMVSVSNSNMIQFKNAGSYLSLRFFGEGVKVKSIKLKGNDGEKLAGKATITMPLGGTPTVDMQNDATDEIVLVCDEPVFLGAEENSCIDFWLVLPPTTFSKGFTVTVTDHRDRTFTKSTSSSLSFGRNTLLKMKPIKVTIDTSGSDPDEGGTESGLYLGMSTFERYLTYYPTHLISEETLESYNDIVDNLELTTLNGTALYYSIDEDITSMQSLTLPDDLFNVSIVTFTDGLDEGSLSYRRGVYKTKAEYLDALHTRLTNEQVSGLPIKSYAIGLKGTDAQSNLTEFRNNLEKIASTPDDVYEITNINELNSSFESIANQLSQKIRVQKVVVSIPFREDGERERFTLDTKNLTTSPTPATQYIEGVFDMDNMRLVDVCYYGITSTSGSIVPVSADDGFNIEFTFEGIQTNDGSEILKENILQWYIPNGGSTWQRNSESTPDNEPKVFTELRSALVMLNLDLSKSLEGQLPTLKSGVKSFLSRLYNASVDPDVIKKVRLNMTSMDLIIGQNQTLQATISPSTASGNTLVWSSAIPSVATVSQSGKVTAVSEGTTIISVSTEDGKEMATCTVTVRFQHVESISLDKSNLQMYVGKTATLVATVSPSNANNPAVTWTSSNPDVASVNESGVITALTEGNTTITASSVDGNKTATCSVSVAEFIPSSTPRDLTLAVSLPTGGRYFLQKDDLQYVNLDDYVVEGLYVVGLSAFIVALEDATSDNVCYEAANAFFNLPNGDQGMAISSRFTDINNALVSFGGKALRSGYQYYWTTEQGSKTTLHKCINGSGGTLLEIDNTSYNNIREVIPLSHESPWTPTLPNTGLFLSVSNGSSRLLLSSKNNIPDGYSPEGLAISSKNTHIIIGLSDASSNQMTYAAASALYGSTIPTPNQAKLISARFTDINKALVSFGGKGLYSGYNYYWTTGQGSSSSFQKCIKGSGGALVDIDKTSNHYVRLIIDNNW